MSNRRATDRRSSLRGPVVVDAVKQTARRWDPVTALSMLAVPRYPDSDFLAIERIWTIFSRGDKRF